MSAPLHLAFVWHMHQPWYRDPANGQLLLPWVRLHGVSAYRDMADQLAAHPRIRATVNLTPSLLDQLHTYLDGGRDTYESITLRPAQELTAEEREFLLRHFFSVHWAAVIPRLPRYQALLEKRGREVPPGSWREVSATFSVDELRDLQVLFNLAWIGHSTGADEEIQALIARGAGFSEEDKRLVLAKHREILGGVLTAWRELIDRGTVEPTCSPYYHPILPLLIDSNLARRGTPEARLPERFCFPGDAQLQIERAISRVEQEFGVRPAGLWPSEAALSPETVALAQHTGIRHMVTDAEILYRSLDEGGSTPGRRRLCQPYRLMGCAIFFRDGTLSDRIAREYASWSDAGAAAADFLGHVRQTAREARVDGSAPPLVVVALDGENPWEAYPGRGQAFLDTLYRQLEEAADIRCVTLAEHLAEHPPTVNLEYLHSGSWIEANFAIWIGDPEKNRAWNLLGRARKRLARAQSDGTLAEEAYDEALEHLLRAQASDWFWWLGEPFSSVEDNLYDEIFRNHILAMYRALGESAPVDLARPIAQGGIVTPLRQPTTFIQPRIDGKRTAFFEWRGAGYYRVPAGGSIYQEHAFITGLYWGFDAGRLFLRLDALEEHRESSSLSFGELEISFELSSPERTIRGSFEFQGTPCLHLTATRPGGAAQDLGLVEEVAHQDVLEVAMPLARLDLGRGMKVGLRVFFSREGTILSQVPVQGVIEVEVPGDDFGS